MLLGIGYIVITNSRATNKKNPQLVPAPSGNTRDTARQPGNIPILTLADGSIINLLEASNGFLHQQGAYKIYKHDNEIKYEPGDSRTSDSEMYNTLSAAAGTRFNIIFPDGSKALLNVASSIRVPVSSAMMRTVDMTGEAEFEVIHVKEKPFRVNINQPSGKIIGVVEVTGTTFNINAYEEEESGKITLLNGTMKVFTASTSVVENKPVVMTNPERELKPGQQAQLRDGRISIIDNVDTAAVTAWKKGILQYKSISTRKLLSMLEKWYGIEVDYALSLIPDCNHYVTITPDLTFETVMEGLKVQCPQLYIRIKSK